MIALVLGPEFIAQAQSQAVPDKSFWYFLFYFAIPFIAPCITVGLGGWWLQRGFVSRANASAFADALVKRMDEILVDSLEYWNIHEPDVVQAKRAKVLAQKIKGSVRTLSGDVQHFKKKYAKKEDFDSSLVNLLDTSTGGSFESANRIADPDRYLLIVNQVNDLKSKLIRVKL